MTKYVCSSDKNIQDILIPSCLNALMNCSKCFNIDIVMLSILAMDNAKAVKIQQLCYLPSIKKSVVPI